MNGPVDLSLDLGGARAAIRLFHPKGNIVTAEMIAARRRACTGGRTSAPCCRSSSGYTWTL